MIEKIVISGFGGQGILFAGNLLANLAMNEGKEVTFFPSYGAEMRGGTCNCGVVISDKSITSPVVIHPDDIIVMNKPSLTKFLPTLKSGGRVFINKSLVDNEPARDDLSFYYIDANKLAEKIGDIKVANIIMLGYFIKITNLIKFETVVESIKKIFSATKQSLIDINLEAFKLGYTFEPC